MSKVSPFATPIQNSIELTNETLILINTYFMIIYSDFVPDPYTRSLMGDVNNAILALMILINLFIIVKSQIADIKHRCRRKKNNQKSPDMSEQDC